MDQFKAIQEAKVVLKVNIEPILSLAKECVPDIPVRTKVIDSKYNTSDIASALLKGAYLLEHKYESYLISPEDVAKVAGFNDLIKNGGGDIKIGRKGFKFNVKKGTLTSPKTNKLEVLGGEPIEEVIPNKLKQEDKKLIEKGPVIYALKHILNQQLVDDLYDGKDEDYKQGFYVTNYKDGIEILLMSSFDLTKGESFYIFGQQHTSKSQRFVYVDMENEYRYSKLSRRQVQPPRAYSKGFVKNRADGMFVAK